MAVLFSRFTDFHIDFSLAPTNRRWRQSTLSADWLALRGACGVKLLLSSRHRHAGSRPTLENSPCFLYFLSRDHEGAAARTIRGCVCHGGGMQVVVRSDGRVGAQVDGGRPRRDKGRPRRGRGRGRKSHDAPINPHPDIATSGAIAGCCGGPLTPASRRPSSLPNTHLPGPPPFHSPPRMLSLRPSLACWSTGPRQTGEGGESISSYPSPPSCSSQHPYTPLHPYTLSLYADSGR